MKLEWEECPRPGCLWIGRADGRRYLATSGEEKLKIQGEHNAYIEQIAAANGYVKVASKTILVNCDRCGGSGIQFFDGLPNAACSYCGGKGHYPVERDIPIPNGYVKLEPGQVVVQVEDLTRIVTWFKGDARTVPHADMNTTLNRFAAALAREVKP